MVEQRVTIKISKQMHDFLNKTGNRNETFEEIIWRLILTKTYDDETKKVIKEAQKNFEQFS